MSSAGAGCLHIVSLDADSNGLSRFPSERDHYLLEGYRQVERLQEHMSSVQLEREQELLRREERDAHVHTEMMKRRHALARHEDERTEVTARWCGPPQMMLIAGDGG